MRRADTTRASHISSARPRRMLAAAIENCSADTNPMRAMYPIRSTQSDFISVLISSSLVCAEGLLGERGNRSGRDPRQTSEVAWFAPALVARPARQPVDLGSGADEASASKG